MNIVIGTNIFIAVLLKDSAVRYILLDSTHEFLFPEVIFEEIENHKKEFLEKSKLDVLEFDELIDNLVRYVKIVSTEKINLYKEKAHKIIDSIDSDDAPFFATSLAFDCCPIWSDDRKLKSQYVIPIYNTKEIVELV